MKVLAALFAAPLLLTGAAHAQTHVWGTEYLADYPQAVALCRQAKALQPPASDRPEAVAAQALKGCSSEALYYGIGVMAQPDKARQCAFLEEADPDAGGVFSGKVMLMTIYANGVGARRDLDLAIKYACDIDQAPAEFDGRVRHLAEMKTRAKAETFDYCDDITSGLAGGYCASHEADIAKARRDIQSRTLMVRWTPAEKAAFTPLNAKFEAYVEAHAGNEVDMSGTLRAALSIAAEEALREAFLATLQTLSHGKPPALDYRAEDARLNAAYQAAMKVPEEDLGTVTHAGIRTAQRAWLAYRDAFVAFAKVKYPTVSGDTVAAWLTQQRTKTLQDG